MIRHRNLDAYNDAISKLIAEEAPKYIVPLRFQVGKFQVIATCESYLDESFVDLFMNNVARGCHVPVDELEPYRDELRAMVKKSFEHRYDCSFVSDYYHNEIRWPLFKRTVVSMLNIQKRDLTFPLKVVDCPFIKRYELRELLPYFAAVMICVLRDLKENGTLDISTDVKRGALLKFLDIQYMINCGCNYTQYSAPIREIMPDFVNRVFHMIDDELGYGIRLIDRYQLMLTSPMLICPFSIVLIGTSIPSISIPKYPGFPFVVKLSCVRIYRKILLNYLLHKWLYIIQLNFIPSCVKS